MHIDVMPYRVYFAARKRGALQARVTICIWQFKSRLRASCFISKVRGDRVTARKPNKVDKIEMNILEKYIKVKNLKRFHSKRWITRLVDRWRTGPAPRISANCRHKEHRCFERILRYRASSIPRLSEGRIKNRIRLYIYRSSITDIMKEIDFRLIELRTVVKS